MTNASVNSPQASPDTSRGARADAFIRIASMIALALVAVQFLLAGTAVFGGDFNLHVMIGRLLGGWTLVVLVAVLVARVGKVDITVAALLLVFTAGVQSMLAQIGMSGGIPVLGGLHALNGLFIGGLASHLLARASTRQKQRAQAA